MLVFGMNILQDGDTKQTSNPYEFPGLELYKTSQNLQKTCTVIFWMEVNSKDTVKVLLGVNKFWLFNVLHTNYECVCLLVRHQDVILVNCAVT
jgi:hypothetical protein